jgi:hypothetical protein
MKADLMTKPLATPRFLELKEMMNIKSRKLFMEEKTNFRAQTALYSAAVTANLGKGAVGSVAKIYSKLDHLSAYISKMIT